MAKKKETKQDPIEMVLDLIDTVNESIKNIHSRIDECVKRIDSISELKSNAESNISDEMRKMVNRMAKRMGME
tara:strand:+ start:223 stop:441 length:219 start_codon:yes stop_codon:yes gene_type:complete